MSEIGLYRLAAIPPKVMQESKEPTKLQAVLDDQWIGLTMDNTVDPINILFVSPTFRVLDWASIKVSKQSLVEVRERKDTEVIHAMWHFLAKFCEMLESPLNLLALMLTQD